ncbi:MAG: metallophosphoesterase family protein [Geminicoccaceae bacterium]
MSADTRSGRVCPLRYRYSVESLDRPPQIRAHTAYVVGGLYGNREAFDTILAMAAQERRRGVDVTLIFNGDFHWLDIGPEDFVHISETVLRHAATSGNVEAELGAEDEGAGCGCAYPDYVDQAVVARSNAIMRRLQAVAAPFPELRRRLANLPMTLTLRIGGERIAILHGDPASLAGWSFAVEAMPPGGTVPAQRIHDYFRRARARVFACTHTGLPFAQRFVVEGQPHLVVNNGSAGMPNFAATRCGVITRISADERIPEASLYGCQLDGLRVDALPVRYDHEAWLRRFRRDWPERSPAHQSYHRRLVDGPDFSLRQAARDGVTLYAKRGRA